MARIAPGRQAITEVVLRPRIAFSGAMPDTATIAGLHESGHER
jgi:hypothetical protein